jgi:GTP cyclohydrolase I
MLQTALIHGRDAGEFSYNGTRKNPLIRHNILSRSKKKNPSHKHRGKWIKFIKGNRHWKRGKKHHASQANDKRTLAPSDNHSLEDDFICPKPLATSDSPVIEFDGLSRPSIGTRDRLEESFEESAARLKRLEGAVRTLLECIGEDPNREGLLATPERYAKTIMYLTKGYEENVLDIVKGAVFNEHHSEMVIVKDIEIYSLCEHHLVPFSGMMHVGYIPKTSVIGLSKLARIAEVFSRRLQVQERLTKSVAEVIYNILQPQVVAVVMESKHLCMAMRGVQKTSSTTVTNCMIGCFKQQSKTRNEFLRLIR